MAAIPDDGGLRLQAAQRGRPEVGVTRQHRPREPRGEVHSNSSLITVDVTQDL